MPVRTLSTNHRFFCLFVTIVFSCVGRELNADLIVHAWGSNQSGQLGDGTTVTRNIPVAAINLGGGVAVVSAGGNHSLAIQNGAAYAWGLNANGQL
jgi:alpha-tubulin suppressor-like RCC1 family protein